MTEVQQQTPYLLMGGEKMILKLVERFYFYMDTLPEAKELRAIHAPDLSAAKEKLFKFLSGWLGGPDLFIQEYGHPRLRQRHFPFKVNQQVRDQWVFCMHKALYEIAMPDELRKNIKQAIDDLATHMINAE
ncbi:globin [Methyloprofundus sedimenti]|uniref:Globin n=1 Tax=Methyloprofundus sedimenti TaxID=1420851 RepID=A0A1V8M6L3_9GAMM|nr:group II truncated hemoglobin [Methyloprofundus sedimenti]OQK17195.1 globin [Methyloprofundus sedimenti]